MRILKDFERFYMAIFENTVKEDIDFLEVAMNIAMLPTFQLEKYHNSFLKKLEIFEKNSGNNIPVLHKIIGLLSVLFNFWLENGRLPPKRTEIYELLYNYIVIDLNAAKDCTLEEAEKDNDVEHNAFSPEVNPKTKFILESLRKGVYLKEVKRIVDMMIENEEYVERANYPNDYPLRLSTIISFIEHNILIESETSNEYKSAVNKFYDGLTNEDVSKPVFANYDAEKDCICFEKDKIFILKALMYSFELTYKDFIRSKEINDSLNKSITKLRESFKAQVSVFESFNEALETANTYLIMENEALKRKASAVKKELVISDVHQIKIDELTADLARVTEERNQMYDMIQNLSQNIEKVFGQEEKETVILATCIAYFGLPNPALRNILSRKGIELEEYSAVDIPNKVPDIPIFFNVDVASHKVWNIIKDKKPITVSGSNPKILSNQIIKHLNRLKEK